MYIVLEHSTENQGIKMSDEKIHGVYINREEAEGKANKIRRIQMKNKLMTVQHVSILKKPVQGKQAPHPIWEW